MARVLLTGPPGSGKTTLTLRVIALLHKRGEPLAGFTTSDVRRGGRRTGFVITGIGGLERTLAVAGGPGPRVGSYGVDVGAFEQVALLEVENGIELGTTLVVDEIGKMELLSARFQELLPAIFEAPRLLATVPLQRHPLLDPYKEGPDVHLITVGPRNRPDIAEIVADLVLDSAYSSR